MQHALRIATYSQIFVLSYAPKPIEHIDLNMASQRTLFHNGIEPPKKQGLWVSFEMSRNSVPCP